MISKGNWLLFVAVTATMFLTLPATADDVIQGWFREINSSRTTLTITARDKSRMEFQITPDTKVIDADGKELKARFKSRKLKRGVKVVVTATTKASVATQLKIERWK